jgi:signal transduction histidine kinase
VEQLFELSKLDARQTQAHLEPFSITDLVQDVVMKFKPWAEKSHIELQAVLPEQLPQVYADIGLIERALSNLIENALRYTPEDGNVKIVIDKSEQTVKVVVADTGSGIQEEELPLIFDRFYRVEKSRARATGGAGLGLAIAKKIIDLHQSSIAVESKVNVGTTFSFNLKAWQSA